MKIAGYIAELLYEYECVVIPGLGGFLARDHAASVNPIKHYFKPAHREIVFNPLLRTNDGLLLNYIARSEKLSYQDAKGRLDRFVLKCLEVMAAGKRINFRSIGSIYYNSEKQIIFEPDEFQNYLSEAFGLSAFVSPPIKREEFQHKVEKVFRKPPNKMEDAPAPELPKIDKRSEIPRMVASKRPSRFRRQLIVITAAASVMFGAWAFMNRNMVQQYYHEYSGYASLLPIFYASPNEYLIKHMDKIPVDKLVIDNSLPDQNSISSLLRLSQNNLVPADSYQVSEERPEIIQSEKTTEDEVLTSSDNNNELNVTVDSSMDLPEQTIVETYVVVDPLPEKENPVVENKNQKNYTGKTYYIIAGAFREQQNAEKLIRSLKAKNYEADYIGKTSGGLWRVSFLSTNDEAEANKHLQAIRKDENEHAWLLVI